MSSGQEKPANPVTVRYFDIEWLSRHDGPGARVVIYLQGCHLACSWCHSPHSRYERSPVLYFENRCLLCDRCAKVCPEGLRGVTSRTGINDIENCRRCGACVAVCPASRADHSASALVLPTRETTPEALFAMVLPQLELLRNIGGLTLSGGEALLQSAGAVRLLELARTAGFHTAVETSGLLPLEHYTAVAGYVDCWLFGLRSDNQGADAPQGFGRRSQNLGYLASLTSRVIVRKPLVAGVTDTAEETDATIALMKACGVSQIDLFPLNTHTSHFYRALGQVAPAMDSFIPSAERVAAVRERFAESGFSVISYNDAANLTQGE